MFKDIKRVLKRQTKGKLQQFLQLKDEGFQMVLVDKPKTRPTTCIKSSNDRNSMPASSLPPNGFKPMATSTPKRKYTSLEKADEANTKLETRLTMSQFIGKLPGSSKQYHKVTTVPQQLCKKSPKHVAVKLRNFVNEAPNAFETIVVDDFTDNDIRQPVIGPMLPMRLNEECENKVKDQVQGQLDFLKPKKSNNPVVIPALDSTKAVFKPILSGEFSSSSRQTTAFKDTIECILNAKDNVQPRKEAFQSLEKLLFGRSQNNDSTQFAFENLFENVLEKELLQVMPSPCFPEFKVPSVQTIPHPQKRIIPKKGDLLQKHIIQPTTNDSMFLNLSFLWNAPEHRQGIKDPVQNSYQFERELQMLLQINQRRKKDNNRANDSPLVGFVQLDDMTLNESMKGKRLENDNVEFWTKNGDISSSGDLLQRI